MATFSLFQKLVRNIATGIFRGVNGENFVQSILGLPANLTLEAARLATKLSWTKSAEQPDDALPLVGEERLLNAMPLETAANYRGRLSRAWDLWPKAGSPSSIEDLLLDGGYPLTVVERQQWPTRPPFPWWSVFWLLDDAGSIPAGPAPTYGGPNTYGQVGVFYAVTQDPLQPLPPINEVVSSICVAVNKTRPAHVILGSIVIPGTAPLYGTPPGLLYGGGALYGGTPPVVISC